MVNTLKGEVYQPGLKKVKRSRKSEVGSKFCDSYLDPDPKRSAIDAMKLKPLNFVKSDADTLLNIKLIHLMTTEN
ncbi:MAG: hypothetical protein V7K27_00995 [Nostoc sp.]|uniref:hypothetical protein n=1 Tax=Nostoc sp. TaxID=1180 RepID=UPI002FFA5619